MVHCRFRPLCVCFIILFKDLFGLTFFFSFISQVGMPVLRFLSFFLSFSFFSMRRDFFFLPVCIVVIVLSSTFKMCSAVTRSNMCFQALSPVRSVAHICKQAGRVRNGPQDDPFS
uniref:Uncharacterized protein n=1 Tax=Ixodes ricinus TaxID=34613 RepID=A0A6B0UL36_IXORI